MQSILDAINEWIKEILIGAINGNLSTMFGDVNEKVGTIAAPETTCCAISNTAIVIVKVWVTRYTATHALKNHLKNMNVSISCILFFSVTMLISSTHRT